MDGYIGVNDPPVGFLFLFLFIFYTFLTLTAYLQRLSIFPSKHKHLIFLPILPLSSQKSLKH